MSGSDEWRKLNALVDAGHLKIGVHRSLSLAIIEKTDFIRPLIGVACIASVVISIVLWKLGVHAVISVFAGLGIFIGTPYLFSGVVRIRAAHKAIKLLLADRDFFETSYTSGIVTVLNVESAEVFKHPRDWPEALHDL